METTIFRDGFSREQLLEGEIQLTEPRFRNVNVGGIEFRSVVPPD